jgi:hypothetical protein
MRRLLLAGWFSRLICILESSYRTRNTRSATDFFPPVTSKMADSDLFENRILMHIIRRRLYRFPLYAVVYII